MKTEDVIFFYKKKLEMSSHIKLDDKSLFLPEKTP